MEENLPGVFNAAGLMVPSIIPLPMPFIDDVVAGTVAEYMVANVANPCVFGRQSCSPEGPTAPKCRQQNHGEMATAMPVQLAVLTVNAGASCRMQASRARKA